MKEYIKVFKDWKKLARPNKWEIFWTIFFVLLAQVFVLVIIPMFSAELTAQMSANNYNTAIWMAVAVIVAYAAKNFAWLGNYLVYPKLIKTTYARINNEFITKTLKAKSANFDNVSKERILNTIHTDVLTVADFGDKITTAFGRLIMTIVSIVIIFLSSIYAGIIVVVADIIDFIIFSWFNKKRQVYVKSLRAINDKQYEKFSEIVDKREAIQDLGQEKRMRKEYNELVDEYIKELRKRTIWDNIKENHYQTIYRFLIFIATLVCIFLVSGGSMTVAVYFTIIAYVTDGITATKDMYNISTYFNEVNVATQRVNAVLDFVDRDEVEVGKNSFKDILGSISFSKVVYKKDDEGNPSLKKFDVLIKENETTLLLGSKSCGKRTIFNLLRRNIKPQQGKIMLDGVNIYDYTTSAYRNIFSYVSTQPIFFKGSIMKNLTIQEKNQKVVQEVCKELGIYNYIKSLPKKFNTNITELPFEKQYLIALARSILTTSQILVLYEFPSNLSDKERENVKKLLRSMQGSRTILIFSAKEYCADIANKIIYIENGDIKNITYTEKADFI